MQDGYDQTLSGLIRKRAELAAEVTSLRASLDTNLAALDAVEAVIRVFNPELAGEYLPVNRPAVVLTEVTGEVSRCLLTFMRERQGVPIKTTEAAEELMRVKGMDPRDRFGSTLVRKRVTDAFRRLRDRGVVVGRRYGSGTELEWRLASLSVSTHNQA
jgi:hypothetical protein